MMSMCTRNTLASSAGVKAAVSGSAAPRLTRRSSTRTATMAARQSFQQQSTDLMERIKSNCMKVVGPALGTQILLALPALAEEEAKEPGKLFDFDYTLPIMGAQFLLLMVFLDKTWFSPVGKVLDDRDEKLRNLLSGVQDNSAELTALDEQASALLSEARQEAAAMVGQAKKDAEAAGTEKVAALKLKLDAELADKLAQLEREEDQARKELEPEIEKLASDIQKKVLPA